MNYSIIIPHKNTPELLERCIQSIPQRSDLEVIVVDDNSTKSIGEENVPSMSRNDVKFIANKESQGAGHSRNIALEHATGKWLLFADADDFFSEKLPMILQRYESDETTDMVILNAKSIDDNNNIRDLSLNQYIDNYNKGRKHSKEVLCFGFWSPWSRMIKRSIVEHHDIKFEEIPVGNDMMFILNASRWAKNVKVETDVVYFYYKPAGGSITSSYWNEKTKILRFESTLKLDQFYTEIGYPYKVPIWRAAKGLERSKISMLKKRYRYNKCSDYLNTIIYFYAKFKGIL